MSDFQATILTMTIMLSTLCVCGALGDVAKAIREAKLSVKRKDSK